MPDAKKARPEVNALVSELLQKLAETDVRDLEVRRNGIRVRVSRGMPAFATAHQATAVAKAAAPSASAPAAPVLALVPAAPSAGGLQITAPLTGIFYRTPNPQAPPFVQVGSVIASGDVVALIEAMKLFNEIRATRGGIVRRVLAENGQLVKVQAPLFELDPA